MVKEQKVSRVSKWSLTYQTRMWKENFPGANIIWYIYEVKKYPIFTGLCSTDSPFWSRLPEASRSGAVQRVWQRGHTVLGVLRRWATSENTLLPSSQKRSLLTQLRAMFETAKEAFSTPFQVPYQKSIRAVTHLSWFIYAYLHIERWAKGERKTCTQAVFSFITPFTDIIHICDIYVCKFPSHYYWRYFVSLNLSFYLFFIRCEVFNCEKKKKNILEVGQRVRERCDIRPGHCWGGAVLLSARGSTVLPKNQEITFHPEEKRRQLGIAAPKGGQWGKPFFGAQPI